MSESSLEICFHFSLNVAKELIKIERTPISANRTSYCDQIRFGVGCSRSSRTKSVKGLTEIGDVLVLMFVLMLVFVLLLLLMFVLMLVLVLLLLFLFLFRFRFLLVFVLMLMLVLVFVFLLGVMFRFSDVSGDRLPLRSIPFRAFRRGV